MEPPPQPPSSTPPDHAAVFDGPINLQRLVAAVGDPGAGAIATFLGVTRDNFQGPSVISVTIMQACSTDLDLVWCLTSVVDVCSVRQTAHTQNPGKTVVRLEYEGYVPMAERVMQSICAQVGQRFTYARARPTQHP